MNKTNLIRQISTLICWMIIGVFVTILFHYPFISSSFNKFPGDDGDSRFSAFLMEHIFLWFNNKSTFDSPSFFYPTVGTLGLSETHLLHGIVYSMIRIFNLSVMKSFSITIFVLNTFTYIASFFFIRFGMKLNLFPAIVGALIFSFNSAKLNQMNHTQLQPLLLIPLISWLFILIHERCKNNIYKKQVYTYSFFAITIFHLQLWTSFYIAWFYSIILFFGLLFLLTAQTVRIYLIKFIRKNIIVIIFSSIVFVLYSIPYLKLYLPILKEYGGRSYSEIDSMLPQLWSYLFMGNKNVMWGWVPMHEFYSLPIWPEHQIGIGLIFSCFALLSFCWALKGFFKVQGGRLGLRWTGLRTFSIISSRFDASKYFLLIGCLGVLVFFILSLKVNSSHWGIIYSNIPGASSVRAVTRYTLIAYFFVGMFVAVVLNEIENQTYSSKIKKICFISLTYVVIAFGIFEQTGSAAFSESIHSNNFVNSVAKKIKPSCDSFYLMASQDFPRPIWAIHVDAMMASHLTNTPTINGYSGNNPQNYGLWNPKAKNIMNSIKDWKTSTNIGGKICIIQHEIIH